LRFNFFAAALLALLLCLAGAGTVLAAAQTVAPWSVTPWSSADTNWLTNNSGQSYDPYVISTADELAGLAKLVTEGNTFRYKHIILSGDIDLEGKEWMPIGYFDTYTNQWFRAFSGTFDGRGYTISGLNCRSGRYGNLFGYIEDSGTVKNLVVEGDVAGSQTASDGAGIMAAWIDGTVENCVVDGNVKAGFTGGYRSYGGMVASLAGRGKIRNVITSGTLNSLSGMSYGGGILGYVQDSGVVIENCSVNVDSIRSVMSAGGIIGSNLGMTNAVYNNVSTAGLVFASSPAAATMGGVMGYAIGRYGSNNHWLKEPNNPNQPEYFDKSGYAAGKAASVAQLPIVSVWPLKPITLASGDTTNVSAGLYPRGGDPSGLVFQWTSSKPAVASVSADGAAVLLTGVADGKTQLTLRVSNPSWSGRGWISVSCPVTVGTGVGDNDRPPSEPASLTAEPGENQVALEWGAPSNSGSSPITGYEASDGTAAEDGTGAEWVPLGAGVTTYKFEGLKTGTSYDFAVRALNSAGEGDVATVTASTLGAAGGTKITSDSGIQSSQKAFVAQDLGIPEEQFREDDDGGVILLPEEVLTIVRLTWAEAEFDIDKVVSLPIVHKFVESVGALARFSFKLKGSALMADRAEDMLVVKVLSGDKAGSFSYAAAESEYGDKKFTVLKDGEIYAGEIEDDGDYELVLFVADNGDFDIDRTYMNVLDPSGILKRPANFINPEPGPGSPGPGPKPSSSPSLGGDGCSAQGFSILALAALAVVPFIRGGKRRPK
jgi:hypothetical protein